MIVVRAFRCPVTRPHFSREKAFWLAEDSREEAHSIARAGLQMLLPVGLASFVALYLFADFIARRVFYTPELAVLLKIVSFQIPFGVAGITGAALATMTSYILINLLYSLSLLRHSHIHPFTVAYLRPAAGAAITGFAIYAVARSLPLSFCMLPLYFLLFVGGYAASLLITKGIEREDIFIFQEVMKKLGAEGAVGFLSRFVKLRLFHESFL
jgi:O-antigen/teichoic acid export membrane protein